MGTLLDRLRAPDVLVLVRVIAVLYVACMIAVAVMAVRDMHRRVKLHERFQEIMSRERWEFLD